MEKMEEIIVAIQHYITLSHQLVEKLIKETNQPHIESIRSGNYDDIEHTEIEMLPGNWDYGIHGNHCQFYNTETGQTLEVFILNKEAVGDLDPYFFYQFLKTTDNFKNLATLFEPDPFRQVYDLFDELVEEGLLQIIYSCQYRPTNTIYKIQANDDGKN